MPISIYNKTKIAAERIFLSYSDKINVYNIRSATVCGLSPRMRFDLTVNMFVSQAFNKKQISSLKKICLKLIRRYKINTRNIVGHSDVAPLRKIDPGEKFPWKELAKDKIGIWHNYKSAILKKFRKSKILEQDKLNFLRNISNIGYCCTLSNRSSFTKTVKAFQRHYRKELINGILDRECLLIAQNLSKKL